MNLNGGYAMIKYNSTQEELQIAYRSKRPALFYDENQRAHWAVIEEKSTESVDEETQEPITIYEYSYKLLDEASSVVANPTLSGNEATLDGVEIDGTKYKVGGGSGAVTLDDIVDSKGNKRFIEGNGNPGVFDKVTTTYCRWSLSGTHLMCVYAGYAEIGANPEIYSNLAEFAIPEYIANKIKPVYASYIEHKTLEAYKDNGGVQSMDVLVGKSNNTIFFKVNQDVSFTGGNRGFRLQFDLLIDSE